MPWCFWASPELLKTSSWHNRKNGNIEVHILEVQSTQCFELCTRIHCLWLLVLYMLVLDLQIYQSFKFWQVCVSGPIIHMYDTITTHIEKIYKLNHADTSFLIRQLVSISVCIIKLHKTAMRMVNKIIQMPQCFWAMPWLSAADVVPCPSYLSLFSEQKSAAGAPVFRGALSNITESRMFSVFIDGLTGWKWNGYLHAFTSWRHTRNKMCRMSISTRTKI